MSTKRGLVLVKNQCTGRRTDRTSGTIRYGVAKSHDRVQYACTREHRNAYTNVPTFPRTQTFTIGRRWIYKELSPYL